MEVNEIGNQAAYHCRPKNSRLLVLIPDSDRLVDNVEDLVDHQSHSPGPFAEDNHLYRFVLAGFGRRAQP